MSTAHPKMVYRFGDGEADGTAKHKELLGGKGANLAEMCQLGVPVPPGFTITTEVCTGFYQNNRAYPDGLKDEVADAIKWVGGKVGAGFGDPRKPAAGVGALRRARLHAGHDGHGAQPRPERRDR
jgi:pyruvate,orthophosphate dikinase